MHTETLHLPPRTDRNALDAVWLRRLCRDAGADDVGFVKWDRPALAEERPHIERIFPRTRSLISFVVRMNRDNVRSPARSVANAELHHSGDAVNDIARRITAVLERSGVRTLRATGPAPRRPQPPPGLPVENRRRV